MSITAGVVLLLAMTVLSITPADTADFSGVLDRQIKNDTLYLQFHLTPEDFEVDSVLLCIPGHWGSDVVKFDVTGYDTAVNCVAIFRRSEGVPYENGWRAVTERDGKLYFDGRIRIPIDGQPIEGWQCTVTAYRTDKSGDIQEMWTAEYVHPGYVCIGMELYLPSYGYFESQFASPLDKHGHFLGYGVSMEIGVTRAAFSISTSWSGLGGNFAFSEPFRVGYKYYTGTRQNFMPSVYGAVKLSKIKLKTGDAEFRKVDWGLEGGVAFEGPFERFGYHYSTGVGGYHTFEVFLAAGSGFTAKLGTRYLFQKADDLWMIRVSFHLEGWNSIAFRKHFMRENNRPLPHKLLACAGFLPASPFIAAGWIIDKL